MVDPTCSIHTLTSDVIVLADSAVLLVKFRADEQAAGWHLPGGLLRHGEHPEDAARRILREQLGLTPEYVDLAEIESTPGENWHLYFHFRADLDGRPDPGPQVGDARLFQLEHLPAMAHGSWERDVIYRIIAR